MSGHMASEGDINAMVKEVSITWIFKSITKYTFWMIWGKIRIYFCYFQWM